MLSFYHRVINAIQNKVSWQLSDSEELVFLRDAILLVDPSPGIDQKDRNSETRMVQNLHPQTSILPIEFGQLSAGMISCYLYIGSHA